MKYKELSHIVQTYMNNHGYHVIDIVATMVIYTVHRHEIIFKARECLLIVAVGSIVCRKAFI